LKGIKLSKNEDKVVAEVLNWIEANSQKNKGQSAERKAAEQLKKLVAGDTKRIVGIDDKTEVHVGWFVEQSEEIDPKKLFQTNPKLFWELVGIPKTNCIAAMGEKEAAKVMMTKTATNFRVRKEKKK
jgi:hypothetical protein